MRLAGCTSLFGKTREGGYIGYSESMRRCRAAGFTVLDIHFCHALFGTGDLVKDDWERIIRDLRDEAEKMGIEFAQSHPVFIPGSDFSKQSPEMLATYEEMMRRSIIASGILGVKWAALHPVEEKVKAVFDTEASIRKNKETFAAVIELAAKHNVGVAYENMLERASTKRRFTAHAGELAALVDAYNDPGVGACWDFGHGNVLYPDQGFALRTLGRRLKSTHVNDNFGTDDNHLFPFKGTVDWPALMPVLVEIGYDGAFAYETHKEVDRMPDGVKDAIARAGYEIGCYCMSLARKG